MVKICFGLFWLKSYAHFTIFRSVRIFVNRTETHPFAILSESNHAQILLWKKTNTLSSFLILIIRLYNHYYEILPSQLQYENWAFTIAEVTIAEVKNVLYQNNQQSVVDKIQATDFIYI